MRHLLLLIFLSPLHAITVIDPVEPGEKLGWYGELEGDVSFSNGDTNENAIGLGLLFGRGEKGATTFLQGAYSYAEVDDDVDDDSSFVHLRHLRTTKWKHLVAEAFFQLGRDDQSFIERRQLLGMGIRSRWEPSEGLKLHLGLGVVEEQKDLKGQEDLREVLANLYLSSRWKLPRDASLYAVVYFQPRLRDPDFYDNIAEGVYKIPVSDQLNLKIKASYRHTETPAAGKSRDNTSAVVGLAWNF